MSAPAFRRQLDILIDRNLAVHWGGRGALAAMLLQAPIIGGFIGIAWRNQEAAPQTCFVMAVAALWMGCMNACTAVVQERAIYRRERMFGLDIRAYLLSKLAVLSAAAVAQTLLLLLAQARLMHVGGSALETALRFGVLAAANLAAAGLGLAVSCFAKTSYGAVVAVPILLIPQVLFSRIILQGNADNTLPSLLEKLTITKWAYESLIDLRFDGLTWLEQLKSFSALAAGLAAFVALAALKLRADDD